MDTFIGFNRKHLLQLVAYRVVLKSAYFIDGLPDYIFGGCLNIIMRYVYFHISCILS